MIICFFFMDILGWMKEYVLVSRKESNYFGIIARLNSPREVCLFLQIMIIQCSEFVIRHTFKAQHRQTHLHLYPFQFHHDTHFTNSTDVLSVCVCASSV